jgi:hypothetical protein
VVVVGRGGGEGWRRGGWWQGGRRGSVKFQPT